jgi:hypothetical protein
MVQKWGTAPYEMSMERSMEGRRVLDARNAAVNNEDKRWGGVFGSKIFGDRG